MRELAHSLLYPLWLFGLSALLLLASSQPVHASLSFSCPSMHARALPECSDPLTCFDGHGYLSLADMKKTPFGVGFLLSCHYEGGLQASRFYNPGDGKTLDCTISKASGHFTCEVRPIMLKAPVKGPGLLRKKQP